MVVFFSSLALILSAVSVFFVIKRTNAQRLSDAILEDTRIAVRQMINDIDRVCDRDTQLVEIRVEKLKAVLADADRRISVIVREVEAKDRRDAVYSELGKKKKNGKQAAGTLQGDSLFASEKEVVPEAAPEKERVAAPSKKDQILLLSAKGFSTTQIAAKLGMTVTEVEMLLVLHRKNGQLD